VRDIGDRPRGRSATLIVPRASPIGHEVDDHLMQLSGIAQDRRSGSDNDRLSMRMLQAMDARSSLHCLGSDRGKVDALAALLLLREKRPASPGRAPEPAVCAAVSRLRRSRLSSGSRRATPLLSASTGKQCVVEVVRNAAGERSQRLEPARLVLASPGSGAPPRRASSR
jgi:hypothetical protein